MCFFTNSYSGIIFTIAVLLADPRVLLASLLACICATGVGACLPLTADRRDGLLGYNAILVGAGLAMCLRSLLWCLVSSAIAGACSTLLYLGLGKVLKTQLTLSFNITTLLSLVVLKCCGQLTTPDSDTSVQVVDVLSLTQATLSGMSEIFLVSSPWSGMLVIIGICMYSPWAAFTSTLGSFVGTLLGVAFNASPARLSDGIWGYNGALVALWATLHLHPALGPASTGLLAPCAALLSTCVFLGLEQLVKMSQGWIPTCFTLPCILVALLLVSLKHCAMCISAKAEPKPMTEP